MFKNKVIWGIFLALTLFWGVCGEGPLYTHPPIPLQQNKVSIVHLISMRWNVEYSFIFGSCTSQ